MSEAEKLARKTLEAHLPGDITPEEVEMMLFIQSLMPRRTPK